jgi:trigger factor
MQHTVKTLPKGIVEVSVQIPLEDAKNDLERAAQELSAQRPIEGYRPGKAPYDVVKSRFGEMAVYEAALPALVRRSYVKAVTEAHVHTYGEPSINVTKLVPGNQIEYVATVAVIPHVETLADFRTTKVQSKPVTVEEKQVDDTMKELQRMQTKEIRASREIRSGDKVMVDMDLSLSGVPLDGGQARNHGIYLDEEYYIPGVKEQIMGLKEGDKKSFTLKFPETHYQKNIAGKDVDFALTVNEIYELQHPELTDDFAKTLGQESIAKLRAVLRENIEKDAKEKELQRAELELLETLVEKSKFGDIPDIAVNHEVERMLEELKHGVNHRGIEFPDYLQNIGKTVDELKMEFSSQAIKRVKTAILIREVAEREKVEATDAEVLEEVQKLINQSTGDAEMQERLRSEEYQDYLRTTVRNRKVIELLRTAIVQK